MMQVEWSEKGRLAPRVRGSVRVQVAIVVAAEIAAYLLVWAMLLWLLVSAVQWFVEHVG